MWRNFCACSTIAATTSGCECPVELTAIPAAPSRNRLPSTSSTIAPSPRAMTKGYERVYDGDTTAPSRSISALARGPGNEVLMSGAFIKRSYPQSSFRNLRSLPARPLRAVLEHDAAGVQIRADPVGLGEV